MGLSPFYMLTYLSRLEARSYKPLVAGSSPAVSTNQNGSK